MQPHEPSARPCSQTCRRVSVATVTPSLVIRGAPYLLSSTTLRPLGPSVTRTALASTSTPRSIRSRASTENFTSLADISRFLSVRHHPQQQRNARATDESG